MWKIHGNYYDLTDFLDKHPGGAIILNACKGDRDATAAFESYHAMSDMKKIKQIMSKYKIEGEYKSSFNFSEKGFYYLLKNKVNLYFKNKNQSHHADYYWVVKSSIQVLLYFSCFVLACYSDLDLWLRLFFSFFSGHMFIQSGFVIMHDASHLAISTSSKVNETLASIWNSLSLWDNQLWSLHHCFNHHSYTGTIYDPDTIHFKPFVRKSNKEKKSKYIFYNDVLSIFFLVFFPGMWMGQSIIYFKGLVKKKFWKMSIHSYIFLNYEFLLKMFTIFSLVYSNSFLVAYFYIVACNLTYFIFILPDHDSFETHENITYDLTKDWGELQVRNSGNFATNTLLINELFGGINYQIEHHLFPTVSHIHFPEISKIVKKTCEENNIPYVNHDTIYSAVLSVFKNFKNISKN